MKVENLLEAKKEKEIDNRYIGSYADEDSDKDKLSKNDEKYQKEKNVYIGNVKGKNTRRVKNTAANIVNYGNAAFSKSQKSTISNKEKREIENFQKKVDSFFNKKATKQDLIYMANYISKKKMPEKKDLGNEASELDIKNEKRIDNFKNKFYNGVKNQVYINPSRQTVDQNFAEKITKDIVNKNNEGEKKEKTIELERQGNIVANKEGEMYKKTQEDKGFTKTSDAMLHIPAMDGQKGSDIFITFKTTNDFGGGQDNQKEDVKKTLGTIKTSLAVLDGDYYIGASGKLKQYKEGYTTLDPKNENDKYYDMDIVIGNFKIRTHRAISLSQWTVLLNDISKKVNISLKGFKEKYSVVTEEEGIQATAEEVKEIKEVEQFTNSLGKVQNAMEKQDMPTGFIGKIKNKFKNFLTSVKNKISGFFRKIGDKFNLRKKFAKIRRPSEVEPRSDV